MTPFRLEVSQDGVDQIADAYRDMAARSTDLRPMGFPVRDRWLESERRLFGARPWPPKSLSTRRRYRWPVRQFGTGRSVRGNPFGPPLRLTGHLQDTLTTRTASGQLDKVTAQAGRLDLQLGLKARGDAAYGFYQAKHGRDPLAFDTRALDESAGDVVQWLLGHHSDRA